MFRLSSILPVPAMKWRVASAFPLFLAAVSAFVPLQLSPLTRNSGVSALRRSTIADAAKAQAVRRAAPWRRPLRLTAAAASARDGGGDSMQELLKAAAEERKQLQAEGSSIQGTLMLAALVGDRADADSGAGLQALWKALATEYGATIEEDVYAAPEPRFKMMPKSPDRTTQRVATFAPASMPASAVQRVAAVGVGLADFSHSGIIAVKGADRFRFVNGLCTNKVLDAKPGQAMESCFTTKTGRTVDLTTIAVLEDCILILCSASRVQHLYESLDALIFPKDKVEIEDLSLAVARFQLVGPLAASLVATPPLAAEAAATMQVSVWGKEGLVISASGLASPGCTIIVPISGAKAVWDRLASGVKQSDSDAAQLLGSREWEVLRVIEGVPAVDKELTLDYNPLEAALWHTVSFDKGCYVGQETIARLKTYKGLKQQLWGLRLQTREAPEALLGANLFVTGEPAADDTVEGGEGGDGGEGGGGGSRADGRITSVVALGESDGGADIAALAYVRVKSGAVAGTRVTARGVGLGGDGGGVEGRLCDVAYATRGVQKPQTLNPRPQTRKP